MILDNHVQTKIQSGAGSEELAINRFGMGLSTPYTQLGTLHPSHEACYSCAYNVYGASSGTQLYIQGSATKTIAIVSISAAQIMNESKLSTPYSVALQRANTTNTTNISNVDAVALDSLSPLSSAVVIGTSGGAQPYPLSNIKNLMILRQSTSGEKYVSNSNLSVISYGYIFGKPAVLRGKSELFYVNCGNDSAPISPWDKQIVINFIEY